MSNIKIISYERIDKSEGIDFNKTSNSKECMIFYYFYDSDDFRYEPYVCNRSHDFNMTVQNLV